MKQRRYMAAAGLGALVVTGLCRVADAAPMPSASTPAAKEANPAEQFERDLRFFELNAEWILAGPYQADLPDKVAAQQRKLSADIAALPAAHRAEAKKRVASAVRDFKGGIGLNAAEALMSQEGLSYGRTWAESCTKVGKDRLLWRERLLEARVKAWGNISMYVQPPGDSDPTPADVRAGYENARIRIVTALGGSHKCAPDVTGTPLAPAVNASKVAAIALAAAFAARERAVQSLGRVATLVGEKKPHDSTAKAAKTAFDAHLHAARAAQRRYDSLSKDAKTSAKAAEALITARGEYAAAIDAGTTLLREAQAIRSVEDRIQNELTASAAAADEAKTASTDAKAAAAALAKQPAALRAAGRSALDDATALAIAETKLVVPLANDDAKSAAKAAAATASAASKARTASGFDSPAAFTDKRQKSLQRDANTTAAITDARQVLTQIGSAPSATGGAPTRSASAPGACTLDKVDWKKMSYENFDVGRTTNMGDGRIAFNDDSNLQAFISDKGFADTNGDGRPEAFILFNLSAPGWVDGRLLVPHGKLLQLHKGGDGPGFGEWRGDRLVVFVADATCKPRQVGVVDACEEGVKVTGNKVTVRNACNGVNERLELVADVERLRVTKKGTAP
ncbi:MAG TPA: hypothetical protein VK524_05550 [Polyangiaceae bacterium]|nr:hypothetical protein [Polyangiaceae bacterium]